MLETLFYACLAAPWAAMAYIVVAAEVPCRGPERRDGGEGPSGWTVPSTACPRCGGNTWYDSDRDELRCDTCEWPDPEPEL